MGRRHQLINSVIHIIDHNRDGAYRTRHDRQTALIAMMKELSRITEPRMRLNLLSQAFRAAQKSHTKSC